MATYYRTQANPFTAGDPGAVVIAGAQGFSEFFGFTADCGQAALESAVATIQGRPPSPAELNQMVRDIYAAHFGSSQGVTSLQGLQHEAAAKGIQTSVQGDWLSALHANAGVKPVVLGLNNAGTLPGEHPGLQGHFIDILGIGPKGYVASDPNTTAAKSGGLVYFTEAQLKSASPWGALVPVGTPTGGGGGLTPWQQVQEAVGFNIGQAAATASTAANNLNPVVGVADAIGNLQHGATKAIENAGLLTVALLVIVLGVVLLAWEPIKTGAGAVRDGALDAAKAAPLAAA